MAVPWKLLNRKRLLSRRLPGSLSTRCMLGNTPNHSLSGPRLQPHMTPSAAIVVVECPAYGQQCHVCGRHNHFARCCRSQTGQSKASLKLYSKASTRQYDRAPQKQNNQFTGKYMPKVNKLAVSSSSDDEYVHVIDKVLGDVRHPRSAVTVNGQCVELLIDYGSNVNLLDKFTFDQPYSPSCHKENTFVWI